MTPKTHKRIITLKLGTKNEYLQIIAQKGETIKVTIETTKEET